MFLFSLFNCNTKLVIFTSSVCSYPVSTCMVPEARTQGSVGGGGGEGVRTQPP